MKTYLDKMQKIAMTIAVFAITAISFISYPALAQDQGPVGYCTPASYAVEQGATHRCYPTAYSWYPRYDHATVNYVKIYPVGTPQDYKLYSWLGEDYDESCYRLILFGEYEGEGELEAGAEYTIEVGVTSFEYQSNWGDYCDASRYSYYCATSELRIFADWNGDADFQDQTFLGTADLEWNEFLNDEDTYGVNNVERMKHNANLDQCSMQVYYNNFTVPEDIEAEKFRIRTIAGYGYGYDSGNWYLSQYGSRWNSNYRTLYSHNACVEGYIYEDWWSGMKYMNDWGGTVDHVVGLGVSIKESFPSDEDGKNILLADERYDGTTRVRADRPDDDPMLFPQPSITIGKAMKEGTTFSYQIYGPYPLPANQDDALVYEALDPHSEIETNVIDLSGSVWGDQLYIPIEEARGDCAYEDGGFESTSGGEYELRMTVTLPEKAPKVIKKRFTVAWANDIAVTGVTAPLTDGYPRYFKYPEGETVDLIAKFTNTGLTPVSKFNATLKVEAPDGTIVYDSTYLWDTSVHGAPELNITDVEFINFGEYKTTQLGQHKVIVTADLKSATDQEEYNDRFARIDMEPYTFATAGTFEAEAYASTIPADGSTNIVANRPFRPIGDFKNNGISDISNAVATYTFTHKETGDTKATTLLIKSLPNGPEGQNIRSKTFPAVTLDRPGTYEGLLSINASGDADDSNDQITFEFEVDDAVEGNFTIGAAGDYKTVTDAMEELYRTGISGPTTLELIDAEYHIGALNNFTPAWDFSTHIIGLSETNTITVKPSAKMAVRPGGIKINLYSGTGEGIRFGQNTSNKYKNAIINETLTADQRAELADNAGYITFDGGHNKSLHFLMHSGSEKSVVMALYHGSHDITIKNTIIENADQSKVAEFIPGSYYNSTAGNVFENDYAADEVAIETYTTGIINRASILKEQIIQKEGEQAQEVTGTLYNVVPNNDNVFENNDISGFSYGIMSLGMGPVIEEDQYTNKSFGNFYNKNTVIENNTITNSTVTGIYLGFEDGAVVTDNVIDNVDGAVETAGIALGGQAHGDYIGYNNQNVEIMNNRIRNVSAPKMTSGIIVEQAHNIYEDPTHGMVNYPNQNDNITIEGNAVWNLSSELPETILNGIYVTAERESEVLGTKKNVKSTIDNIKVLNNTVMLDDDTQGNAFGIGIVNISTAEVLNNAVRISNSNDNAINAALLYQGPKDGTITSNFNVVYTDENSDAVHFIESKPMQDDDDNTYIAILKDGQHGEYPTLRHWMAWTGQDDKSIFGTDFRNDLVISGNEVKVNKNIETSVLSNRGTILNGEEAHIDFNGVTRGQSDEHFDVGAVEFTIPLLKVDYEVSHITAPLAYKETDSKLNDAEYIMTPNPITMAAMVRNNGSTQETDIPVTFTVYRKNYDLNVEWEKVDETTVTVHANKDEYVVANADITIEPKTFADEDWYAHIPNSDWYGMEENVSTLYKVVVEAASDLNHDNNKVENIYRFYVRRAHKWKVMQSNSSNVEKLTTVTENAYAEAANAHAVTAALKEMNLYNVSKAQAKENKELELDTDLEYRQEVDMMNRNAWPERSLNYDGYKTVVYSDGHNDMLTRMNKIQLVDFLEAGTEQKKHNLIIASEEMVRNQQLIDWNKEQDRIDADLNINKELRIEARFPYSPLGLNDAKDDYNDYSGKTVTGITMGGKQTFTVAATEKDGDMYPRPGLFNLQDKEAGITKIGMVYDEVENNDFPEGGRIMSNSFAHVDRNVTVMGVDWRHFENPSDLMKAAIDVMNSNGGIVNPVELYAFDAKQVGQKVELKWTTASENGSSHFEIERAEKGTFAKIKEVDAKGKSSLISYYNTEDYDVVAGKTYTYRLKMVDKDGSFAYSDEIEIEIEGAGLFTVTEIKPNPVKTTATFNVSTAETNNVTIELYNTAGTLEATLFEGTVNGTRTFEINAAELANGAYTVVIRTADKAETMKINIVK